MARRQKQDLFSPSFLEKRSRVVLKVGDSELVYRDMAKVLGAQHTSQAAARLNWILGHFRAKNVLDLAQRINMEHLLAYGAGEAVFDLWCDWLDSEGGNSTRWMDTGLKILTLCEKYRRKRRKR